MKRRTLDIAFSIGGIVFSVLLLVVGLILNNQANFAKTYVHDQLVAQKIYFQPTKTLDAEMSKVTCLVNYGQGGAKENGGAQALDTGKKAECYSNEYIGAHMAAAAKGAGFEGATFATLGKYVLPGQGGADSVSLVDQVQAAKDSGADQATIDGLQTKLDAVKGLRGTLQTGETLRGLLLTTYGFSIFGERAGQAAWVCFGAALVLLILSIAGLVHAFASKKAEDVILVAEHHEPTKEPVAV
ncbi:MAG: hypothetical protein RJA49_2418 [Actinomycetota bacterium]|jgi:hypothetical protein